MLARTMESPDATPNEPTPGLQPDFQIVANESFGRLKELKRLLSREGIASEILAMPAGAGGG